MVERGVAELLEGGVEIVTSSFGCVFVFEKNSRGCIYK